MCVIIVKDSPEKKISYRTLRRAYVANPHGWGIASLDKDGNINVQKGLGKVGELIEAYKTVENDKVVIVHTRIATAGEKDLENCHPFLVTKKFGGVWMFHNGTLQPYQVKQPNKTKSDTWHFARYLQPCIEANELYLEFPEELGFVDDMERFIHRTSTNKIVLLSRYGVVIAGKEKGEVRDGIWYSNTSAFKNSQMHKERVGRWKGGKKTTSLEDWRRDHGYEWADSDYPLASGSGGNSNSKESSLLPEVHRIQRDLAIEMQLMRLASQYRECSDLISEDFSLYETMRADHAQSLLDVLSNMTLSEIQEQIDKNYEGLAEVLYHASRGEIYPGMRECDDDDVITDTQTDETPLALGPGREDEDDATTDESWRARERLYFNGLTSVLLMSNMKPVDEEVAGTLPGYLT